MASALVGPLRDPTLVGLLTGVGEIRDFRSLRKSGVRPPPFFDNVLNNEKGLRFCGPKIAKSVPTFSGVPIFRRLPFLGLGVP